MITITTIWGAVGFAIGVCFATACLTFAALYNDYRNRKNIPKYMDEWENGNWDVIWSEYNDK